MRLAGRYYTIDRGQARLQLNAHERGDSELILWHADGSDLKV
jgi:hypothetical protein